MMADSVQATNEELRTKLMDIQIELQQERSKVREEVQSSLREVEEDNDEHFDPLNVSASHKLEMLHSCRHKSTYNVVKKSFYNMMKMLLRGFSICEFSLASHFSFYYAHIVMTVISQSAQ